MSPARVTFGRTVGMVRGLYSTALSVAGFLSSVGLLFAFNLQRGEGGMMTLAEIWTVSVSPFLPPLAALLAMDVWSDERQTGRIDVLLASPVTERDFMFGKFFGVCALLAGTVILSLVISLGALQYFAPSALSGSGLVAFIPGLIALSFQGALWCAVSVAMSAAFSHAATAACASLTLLVALPRGGWMAALAWAPQGRTAFGEMPLDAHALDMAGGLFSSGTIFAYVILTVLSLFVGSKFVAFLRLAGRGGRRLRVSTGFSVALALVAAALAIVLAFRMDDKLDVPLAHVETGFSARTRDILAESSGEMSVTCFLSRKDARFRPIGRFLRELQRESEAMSGVRIELRFVDPSWDIGAAERLVRLGATEDSLVFEMGRRTAIQPLADGYGERICASVILRLTMPPQRRNVYWTVGHGESAPDAYGPFGLSDIARELSRDGYRNASIDVSSGAQIPNDCALIVIAGAKDDFSRMELGRIDAYLREGGRLLVLMGSASGGVASLLPSWGLRPESVTLTGKGTLSGTDVIVGDFADHAITRPLWGSRIVLERPIGFMPSAAAEAGAGADRIEFTALVKSESAASAVVVERGAGTGEDLSIRPTRIVAIGDAGFVMNGQLASRANANRDFFHNCVAFLSGTDASVASGTESAVLVTGLDRRARLRFAAVLAGGMPFAIFLAMLLSVRRRRRRA
jgi:hypothetical protein